MQHILWNFLEQPFHRTLVSDCFSYYSIISHFLCYHIGDSFQNEHIQIKVFNIL